MLVFDRLMRRAADLIDGCRASTHLGASQYEQLQYMLPAQEKWLGPERSKAFFDCLNRDLRLRHLPTEKHVFCSALLSLVFGYRWMDDPKFEAVAMIFKKHLDSGRFSLALCEYLRRKGSNGGY